MTQGPEQDGPGVVADAVDLSVVIPVRDEAGTIPELVSRLVMTADRMGLSYEIVFVTDINRDNTVDVLRAEHARNRRVKAVRLALGRGQHIAIVAGLDACRGQSIVLMDGDLQDHPEDIPLLYTRLQEGFDVVYGVKERKNESALRNLFSRAFVRGLTWLSDPPLDHNTAMFRIISARMLGELRRFGEHEQTLPGLMALVNLPTATVPVTSGQRYAGETKYSFLRQINFAIGFLLSFSTKPLRLISLLGLAVSGISFAFLTFVLIRALVGGIPVAGFPTLASLVTLLSGVQLFALGAIGEYVGRIFLETKRRPLYVVAEIIGDATPKRSDG